MPWAAACFSRSPARVNDCAKCGSPLPPGSEFCSRCGASVRAAGPVPAPAPRNRWWIVPSILIGVVVLGWLFLRGMPFGTSEAPPERPRVETIAEGTASAGQATAEESATIVDVDMPADDEPERTTPPQTRQPVPPAQPPAPAPRQAPAEITSSDAEAILRNYVTSADYYRVRGECLRINNRGYRNVGYTLEIWDACQPGGASRMLGSWRVDAKTREVFRRRDDGRYLRP